MAKNTKGEQSKNKLIECAADLFWKNGYNATGINDILACTGLPKGSFYFHFASKKDLAIEVSVHFEKRIVEWILKTSEGKAWNQFIIDLVGQMIEGAKNNKHYGCPFAVLGLEIAFSEPDIAEYYSNSMKKLKSIFESVLIFSGIPGDKAPAIASCAFAVYEGHLLFYRISKDIDALRTMQTDLIEIYKSYKEVRV